MRLKALHSGALMSFRFAVTPCVYLNYRYLWANRFWKEPYRTTRISTAAKWDYGSEENQYRATCFFILLMMIREVEKSQVEKWVGP